MVIVQDSIFLLFRVSYVNDNFINESIRTLNLPFEQSYFDHGNKELITYLISLNI